MTEALSMGEHGLYVWLSYGIVGALLVLLGVRPKLAMARLLHDNKTRIEKERSTGS